MDKIVRFSTDDGVEIVGDFLQPTSNMGTVLFLHMMPAERGSWQRFVKKLHTAGYSSLAIDLRGHGESVSQGKRILNYKKFSDAEHHASIRDVEAAVSFLQMSGISKDQIAIVGASIGANLALQYAREHAEVPALVLLSPGLDYRGIKTEPLMKRLSPRQKIFLAASREDEYSFETIRVLSAAKTEGVTTMEFDGLGHGTAMLERKPELMDEVIKWLKESLPGRT